MKQHFFITDILIVCLYTLTFQSVKCNEVVMPQDIFQKFEQAEVKTEGNRLVVTTGVVERVWKWTGNGLVTIGLKNLKTGTEYITREPSHLCDWELPGFKNVNTAQLVSLSVNKSSDQGFTSSHLEVVAGIHYRELKVFTEYLIWVYPNSQGIRTQHRVLALRGYEPPEEQGSVYKGLSDIGISPANWQIKYVDQWLEEDDKGSPEHVFDRKRGTDWFTGHGTSHPHEIQIDLGKTYKMEGLGILSSHDARIINDFQFYVSKDGQHWGEPLADTSFFHSNDMHNFDYFHTNDLQTFEFDTRKGRYVKLVTLSDAGDRGFAGLSEIFLFSDREELVLEPSFRKDYIPVNSENFSRRLIGYYTDLGNRNYMAADIMKEVKIKGALKNQQERYDWASIISLEKNNEGFCLVKESQKCVNQKGYKTGGFICDESGVFVTGWGLAAGDFAYEKYRPGWATWTVVYDGGDDGRQLALKQFDRDRYPVDTETDMYTIANTFGNQTQDSPPTTTESEVLKEIKSVDDLSIDVLQIDGGWNRSGVKNQPNPYRPSKASEYTEGWENVKRVSQNFGITMGLHYHAHYCGFQDLKWNFDHGFYYYKLDFAMMNHYDAIESVIEKVRKFVAYTNHKAIVNWDVTAPPPRVGYYFAREYGDLYLENRKSEFPEKVIYKPSNVLRDGWQLSKYSNLNQYQLIVQNIDLVDKEKSDAYLHTQPYSVAIGLMGTPIFFQSTYLYDKEDREQIRPLMDVYKSHQKEIFTGYVFPLGTKPNNESWTGYQSYHPDRKTGYLMIFRELHNTQVTNELKLRFLEGKRIRIVNLLTGKQHEIKVDQSGKGKFDIPIAPSFKFLRYSIVNE